MPTEIHCSPEAARRALIAQVGLARVERGTIEETVHRLGCVQMDPMQVVAPAHLLTLRLRRGDTSETSLSRALGRGLLFEARVKERCLVSREDLVAAAPQFLHFRARGILARRGLGDVAGRVLAELEAQGPLLAREVESEHRVASFWDTDQSSMKATTMALEILAVEGRVVVSGRVRGARRYALPEMLFPGWDEAIGNAERARHDAAAHFARTMGIFRAADPYMGWRPHDPVAERRSLLGDMIDRGEWVNLRIGDMSGYVCSKEFVDRIEENAPIRGVRLLAPLDQLLWDRRRLWDLFQFHYRWEAYTPAPRRTVGPYGMPVLLDGRFVGEVDARVERGQELRARLIERTPLRPTQRDRIAQHLGALARYLEVEFPERPLT